MDGLHAAMQCLTCGHRVGKRILLGTLGDDGASLDWWERKAGFATVRNRGNSRRQHYRAFLRTPFWRGPGGQRERVLKRDSCVCHWCREQLTEKTATGDHLVYPDPKGPYLTFEAIPDELVVCACVPCQLERRRRSVMAHVFGETRKVAGRDA